MLTSPLTIATLRTGPRWILDIHSPSTTFSDGGDIRQLQYHLCHADVFETRRLYEGDLKKKVNREVFDTYELDL